MAIKTIIIQLDDETDIKNMLRERGIQSLQRQAGYVPQKTKNTWDDAQPLIEGLPTDHILAASYEDAPFIQALIFDEAWETLKAILDKDRI